MTIIFRYSFVYHNNLLEDITSRKVQKILIRRQRERKTIVIIEKYDRNNPLISEYLSVNEKTNAKENRNTNDSFPIKMRFEVYYKKLIMKKHESTNVKRQR